MSPVRGCALHRFIPAIFPVVTLLSPGCTYPDQIPPAPPGPDPRNFTWSIDTIALPGSPSTLMRSIWGSSPRDVYVAGHNDLPGGTMFHYDGTSWRQVTLSVAEGGTIQGVIDISQVFGFTPGVIFAAGGISSSGTTGSPVQSLIIRYNGSLWSAMQVPPGGMLRGIWGLYQSDMWAAGDSGTVIFSQGLAWYPSTFRDTASISAIGGVSADDVYALSSRSYPGVRATTHRYLWHWNGGVWSVADSFAQVAGSPDRFGSRSVWSLLGITYTCGMGLFKRAGTGWDNIIPGGQSGYLNAIYGVANNSLFVAGDGSALFHINETGPYRYPAFTDPAINLYGVWMGGGEAFVVGNDGRRTYVLHGR
jgi:hypothetical protein